MEITPEEIEKELAEDKKESKLYSALIIILGILIILLILSWVFISFPIADILAGKIESTLIKGAEIDLGNFSIFLENKTYDQLDALYFRNTSAEISACLLGQRQGSNYNITSLYVPEIYSQSFSEVVFQPCLNDALIMLHTHPYKQCVASETDISTLNKTKQNNPNILMVVMCEAKRVAIYP